MLYLRSVVLLYVSVCDGSKSHPRQQNKPAEQQKQHQQQLFLRQLLKTDLTLEQLQRNGHY